MIVFYIDILLLIILLFLIVFVCSYCFYRVNRLRQNGEIAILLRPTKVVFSHKKEGESTEELRTVVAYRNPFTGDYCVHKSRHGANGYVNNLQPESPDSGVSDEYEPLNLESMAPQPSLPHTTQDKISNKIVSIAMPQVALAVVTESACDHGQCNLVETSGKSKPDSAKIPLSSEYDDNSVNKTWSWNYKEYQI